MTRGLSCDHDDGVDATWFHEDAIDVTAFSLTRRDGPDVFQRLKIEKETTHFIRRWRRRASTAYEPD